jgi:hypothetical protein
METSLLCGFSGFWFDLVWRQHPGLIHPRTIRPHEWAHYFGQYRSGVFGITGDVMARLLWRLINGEAPKARWSPAGASRSPLDLPAQMHGSVRSSTVLCATCRARCTLCMRWTPTLKQCPSNRPLVCIESLAARRQMYNWFPSRTSHRPVLVCRCKR